MQKHYTKLFCLSILLLNGCASRTKPAPIVNVTKVPSYLNQPAISQLPSNNTTNMAASSDGTTLGSLSSNNQPASSNNTATASNSSATKQTPVDNGVAAAPAVLPNKNNSDWVIPTSGTVVNVFSSGNKGIDYTGKLGQQVVAVHDGKVVYSGNGLKGYGNLIIVKHDSTYLSAYADNLQNVVKEGDNVKKGQKIATMGKVNDKPLLHFEIRKNGKPIDPNQLLNK